MIVSKQNAALFSDHEMIAVDDASETSPFFGNVYVCNAAFRSQEIGGFPEPIVLNSSSDGGDTWRTPALAVGQQQHDRRPAGLRRQHRQQGHRLRLLGRRRQRTKTLAHLHDPLLRRRPEPSSVRQRVVTHIVTTGIPDFTGDLTFDGQAGARDGSFPTVDIANGAPTGADATDQIVLAWSNGPTPSDTSPGPNEQVKVV